MAQEDRNEPRAVRGFRREKGRGEGKRDVEIKPLDYYMGLNYTVELTRSEETLVATVKGLPGCWASAHESEEAGQLWKGLEEAKRKWFEQAISEQRWIPEPPRADDEELSKISQWFEEEQLDVNDAREMLYERGVEFFSIPLLQEMWFRELSSMALYQVSSALPAAPKASAPREIPSRALAGDVRPVPLGKSGRVAWLRLDGARTERGYKEMEILDQPLVTETATISALTILEATGVGQEALGLVLKRVRKAVNELNARSSRPEKDNLNMILIGLLKDWYTNERVKGFSHAQVRALKWSLALLRYRRSEFDSLPFEEQVALFERHCDYVDRLLEASRKHAAFVEYGSQKGLSTRTVETVRDQIRAVILADVENLKHKEIATRMGISFSEAKYKETMEVPEVKNLVIEGRNLLKRALGAEGWRNHAETMKKDADRFDSLSEQERDLEIMADQTGLPIEKVRRYAESGMRDILLLRSSLRAW